MVVGTNSAQVLHQILHFSTAQYYWIDAISINQADNDEKSYQVAMMGEIFGRAESVFASVGMHENDSEYLSQLQTELAELLAKEELCALDLINPNRNSERTTRACDICAIWLESIEDRALERFLKALHEFPKRSYFWRIWILQEIFLARELYIYCEFDEICLPALLFWWREAKMLFPQILTRKLSKEYLAEAPWINGTLFLDQGGSGLSTEFEDMLYGCATLQGSASDRKKLYLSHAINLCAQRGCKDPRDVVYGTLTLADWGTVVPDYNKSIFDLAKEVMAYFHDMAGFIKIMELLRLDPEHLDIKQAIDARMCNDLRPTNRIETGISVDSLRNRGQEVISFVDGGFQLTAELQWKSHRVQNGEMSYCRIDNSDDECCAITSTTIEPGDWIVSAVTDHGFVLRQVGEVFAIVGRAYLRPGHSSEKLTAFRMRLDPEDLVVHLSQGGSTTYNVELLDNKMVTALNTSVCKTPFSSYAEMSIGGTIWSRSTFRDWPYIVSSQVMLHEELYGLRMSSEEDYKKLVDEMAFNDS